MTYQISDYRPIKFLITVQNPEGQIIYNTATGSILFLKKNENIESYLPKLVELYDYVPLDFDEFDWIDKYRKKLKNGSFNGAFHSYTIFTTTGCNARCYYCFERGQQKVSMTSRVAEDVAKFIINNSDSERVVIRWFGGEPLLNQDIIDIICDKLKNSNINFSSRMISNGLLFSSKVIENAKNKWNLKKVQITLDGTKPKYQQIKSYVNSSGNEFDVVMNNIDELSKSEIEVSIRLNQSIDNTIDLYDLVNDLSSRFAGNPFITIYNTLLYQCKATNSLESDSKEYREHQKLQDYILKKEMLPIKRIKNGLVVNMCMADNDGSITISPDGRIGKCEHYPFEKTIGSIYSSNYDSSMIKNWKKQIRPQEQCSDCPLYPQCIRLEMCPQSHPKCTSTQRKNVTNQIKISLLEAYKVHLLENKDSTQL